MRLLTARCALPSVRVTKELVVSSFQAIVLIAFQRGDGRATNSLTQHILSETGLREYNNDD